VAAGILIWDEWPDAATLLGATCIVASGLVILHRETRRNLPAAQADFPVQEVTAAPGPAADHSRR